MNAPLCTKRRRALVRGVALAGSSLLVFSAGMRPAAAQKSSKASLNYQEHPHDGKKCADCKHFSPGSDASGAGTCALVEGPIQPAGWCTVFAPR
jgi:high potential iron-sulfur protein